MPQFIVYQYDPATGHINATNTSNWDADHPYLQLENQVASETLLKDASGNTVAGGWSFVLEGGVPVKQGDGYAVNPPPPYIPPLTTSDYVFMGMVKNGSIDIKTVDPQVIETLNKSLQAAGLPTLGG